jgi:hypothetical protein
MKKKKQQTLGYKYWPYHYDDQANYVKKTDGIMAVDFE